MNFKRTKMYKYIQGRKKKSRNKLVIQCLSELGFSPEQIRGGLMKMNGISVPDLVKANPGLTSPTLYGTIQGRRPNPEAKQATAHALGVDVDEIYPHGGTLT